MRGLRNNINYLMTPLHNKLLLGVHSESYRTSSWIYISDSDELAVWRRPDDPEGK